MGTYTLTVTFSCTEAQAATIKTTAATFAAQNSGTITQSNYLSTP